MTDQERIDNLERKVKNLQIVSYVRFAILALSFLGVTAIIVNKIKKLK